MAQNGQKSFFFSFFFLHKTLEVKKTFALRQDPGRLTPAFPSSSSGIDFSLLKNTIYEIEQKVTIVSRRRQI